MVQTQGWCVRELVLHTPAEQTETRQAGMRPVASPVPSCCRRLSRMTGWSGRKTGHAEHAGLFLTAVMAETWGQPESMPTGSYRKGKRRKTQA